MMYGWKFIKQIFKEKDHHLVEFDFLQSRYEELVRLKGNETTKIAEDDQQWNKIKGEFILNHYEGITKIPLKK